MSDRKLSMMEWRDWCKVICGEKVGFWGGFLDDLRGGVVVKGGGGGRRKAW